MQTELSISGRSVGIDGIRRRIARLPHTVQTVKYRRMNGMFDFEEMELRGATHSF
jgi:hypothetical protein